MGMKNIVSGLIIFFTGVSFVYFSFPFVSGLLSAFDSSGIVWGAEEWELLKYIIWGGYWVVVVLWVVIGPLMAITASDNVSGG